MSKTFRKPKPFTEAQRAAARANGAKSKGPVTAEGKARSALNAVTHGLTSNAVVLTTESRPKMDALLQAYRDEYQPQGQTENDLVEELTAAKWLLRRCWAMQSALLEVTMDRMEPEIETGFKELDNAARTALAFLKQTEQGPTLALLNRYAARHARDYHRALDMLRLIQKERRQAVPGRHPNPAVPNEPEPVQPPSNQPSCRPLTLLSTHPPPVSMAPAGTPVAPEAGRAD